MAGGGLRRDEGVGGEGQWHVDIEGCSRSMMRSCLSRRASINQLPAPEKVPARPAPSPAA